MSKFLVILGIIETVFIILFANFNKNIILSLNYKEISFSSNFFVVCTLVYVLGIIAGVLIMFNELYLGSKKMTSAKRILEKQSVSNDDYELKIRALENKVQTLEAALNKALNKND